MGLTSNQTFFNVRLLGGPIGGTIVPAKSYVANALSFGSITSIPQGYNNPSVSLTPTIRTGGNIAARFKPESSLTALLTANGNMEAILAAEADMVCAANVLANGYATFEAEADMVANLTATGNMEANMDLLARPSAFDIAQEVWAASTSGYTVAGTMGKAQSDTLSAAKLAVALSA